MRRKVRELIEGRARALVRLGICKNWREAVLQADAETRCDARTRKGTPCKARGLGKVGRCKLRGGCSTGPRIPEGKARSIAAAREGYRRWRAEQIAARSTVTKPEKQRRPSPDNAGQKQVGGHATA
jgi:hypothetical protein